MAHALPLLPPPGLRRPARLLGLAALGLVLSVLLYAGLSTLFLQNAIRETPNRAQFFARTIDDALQRLSHLPYVISIDPIALDALVTGEGGGINPVLTRVALKSDAEFIFVMDLTGRTIASSNHDTAQSLVGEFYTFRPYFQEAIAGRFGRFYAVGVTTGRPGYFMAEPVRDATGAVRGAVVVKISLSELSRTWADSGERVLVTNAQGVVLASSHPDLIFGLTAPLSTDDRQSLERQRQFGDRVLTPLDWQAAGANRARLDGTTYLWTRAAVATEDWTLHLLSDLRGIRTRALLFVAAGLSGVLALAIAVTVLRSAQLRTALAISDADRIRLVREIDERRAAEARLQVAQAELARKNRLAALGQMSASITHELGQPISAMRNYLVAEEIAQDSAPGALAPHLTGLVDRMQRIVDQLRSFGRQTPDQTTSFPVADAVGAALALVRHDAARAKVEIRTRIDPDLRITASQPKLEQVIVNLLRNAIDAVRGTPTRQVSMSLTDLGDTLRLAVTDSGPGIGKLDINALTEPFFTTKPSGEGMGLGLAISAQIINDMGGQITASGRADGAPGAEFALILPAGT